MLPHWLTVQQAAMAIGTAIRGEAFSRQWIRDLINAGAFQVYMTPYGRLVHAEDAAAYINQQLAFEAEKGATDAGE